MGRTRTLNLFTMCILALPGAARMNAQCAPDSVTHQLPAICVTAGLLNGHWWNSTLEEVKTGFVIGYGQHAVASGEQACGPAPKDLSQKGNTEWDKWDGCHDEWFAPGLLAGETVSRLDAFYTRAENLDIDIHVAMHIIGMNVVGKPTSEIEQTLSDARKWAALLHAKKKRVE